MHFHTADALNAWLIVATLINIWWAIDNRVQHKRVNKEWFRLVKGIGGIRERMANRGWDHMRDDSLEHQLFGLSTKYRDLLVRRAPNTREIVTNTGRAHDGTEDRGIH